MLLHTPEQYTMENIGENAPTQTPMEINVTDTSTSPTQVQAISTIPEHVTEIEDSINNVGKEDCDALYKECVKVQMENMKYAEKIRRINKVIIRIQKERRFFIKKLDGFGDNYQLAKLKLIEEQESKAAEALRQEDEELAIREPKKVTKKKSKGKRLQNAPKKPSNAFLMFCQKNRNIVQEEYMKTHGSEISRQEMTRKLAELWKKTPKENRKAYYEMYEKDKARYAQEMKDFESRNPKPMQSEAGTSATTGTAASDVPPNSGMT